ncbi:MAG: hypothetical protein ACI85Q_001532 [Salibacteraceae bacterium]|jgi:hypothetical protein
MRKNKLASSKIIYILAITAIIIGCESAPAEIEVSSQELAIETEAVSTYTPKSLAREILNIEKVLEKSSTPNKQNVREKLVEFYHSYAQLFSGDALSPEMLFKAGNQSVNLEKYQDALMYYSLIENKYYEYQKRPEAIYLQGFIYDTYTDELGNAKEKYSLILERYPKHVLAEQARLSLNHIGKSDEELIREFEKQNAN